MLQSCHDMAARLIAAEASGAEQLARIAGLGADDGRKAWRVYVHIGLARADPVTGQAEWRHGGMLERDVIARAVDQYAALMAARPTYWRRKRR